MTIPAPRRRCALRLSPSVIREGLSNRGRSHRVKRFLKAAAPLATLVGAAMAPNRGSIAATPYTAGYAALATRIPAFARKYGLRCSACHTAWPELNAFGQRFKDNGYQLGNDRDSPMWQAPAYWPIAMRTTPQWHLESTTHRSEEHTSELQSPCNLVCRLLLEK